MKILFISLSGLNQNSPLQNMLLMDGFKLSCTLCQNPKPEEGYLVSSISASQTKEEEDGSSLAGNEIIFIEREHAWLMFEKTKTTEILKTEQPVEKIRSIIQNYSQTLPG